MARTHRKPDDALNRPTGLEAPVGTPEEEAAAAMREAGAMLAEEAETAILGAPEPEKAPGPPRPAIGRAAVTPQSMISPAVEAPSMQPPSMQPPSMHAPPVPSPPMPPPAVEPPSEPPPINPLSFEALYFGPSNVEPPPPIESYEQLLGGLGERPFDSPRPVTPEAAWGRTLRRFARSAVWTLPVAAVCLALSGMWGWPTRAAEPAGESPGTWLVVTVFGLILGLAGVLAMTALLSATPGRSWSVGASALVLTGTVLLAPVLGVLALARPSVTRAAGQISPDTAADLDNRFLDNAVSRWLGVGGLALLAAGWLSFGCAVLASGVLNRVDGYLVLCAVAIAVLAAYVSWQFLITVAALILLAAGLGLAWTAYRLRPDGQLTA